MEKESERKNLHFFSGDWRASGNEIWLCTNYTMNAFLNKQTIKHDNGASREKERDLRNSVKDFFCCSLSAISENNLSQLQCLGIIYLRLMQQ